MKGTVLRCRNCGKDREAWELGMPCKCWGGRKPEKADVIAMALAQVKPRAASDYAAQAAQVGHRPWAGWTRH